MPILTQHVGDHDGRQVHVLVGVGWDQAVRREAVAEGVISSFVVHQVQEGRVREIRRRYGRDLIVFVILILTIIRLKHKKDNSQSVTALLLRQRKVIICVRNPKAHSSENGFVLKKKASPALDTSRSQPCRSQAVSAAGLHRPSGMPRVLAHLRTAWGIHTAPLSHAASLSRVFTPPKPQQSPPCPGGSQLAEPTATKRAVSQPAAAFLRQSPSLGTPLSSYSI